MVFLMQVLLLLASSTVVTNQCLKGNEVVTAFSYLQADHNSPQSGVKGTVKLLQQKTGGPTYFKIKVSGLQPDTAHGFHVHASGDIFSQGCKSAGGHYNPFNQTHGAPTDTIRHVGDLGNVYSDKNGNVVVIKRDYLASLVGGNSIIGRAIVLHAKIDDLGRGGDKESKKTGNAGARIACGVIIYA